MAVVAVKMAAMAMIAMANVGGVGICVRTGTSTRRQYPEALAQFIFRAPDTGLQWQWQLNTSIFFFSLSYKKNSSLLFELIVWYRRESLCCGVGFEGRVY